MRMSPNDRSRNVSISSAIILSMCETKLLLKDWSIKVRIPSQYEQKISGTYRLFTRYTTSADCSDVRSISVFQLVGPKFQAQIAHEVDGLIFQPALDVRLTPLHRSSLCSSSTSHISQVDRRVSWSGKKIILLTFVWKYRWNRRPGRNL